jgi:hypothetical protein
MKFKEPTFRCPTKAAIEKLATIFSLPIDPYSQDWEWEVADPTRISEFLNQYKIGALTDDEKFTLLEILLQSFEESNFDLNTSMQWHEFLKLVECDFNLHKYTVWYWCSPNAENTDEQWRITPYMREMYARNA